MDDSSTNNLIVEECNNEEVVSKSDSNPFDEAYFIKFDGSPLSKC